MSYLLKTPCHCCGEMITHIIDPSRGENQSHDGFCSDYCRMRNKHGDCEVAKSIAESLKRKGFKTPPGEPDQLWPSIYSDENEGKE